MDGLYQIKHRRRNTDLLFDQLKEACALLAAEHRVKVRQPRCAFSWSEHASEFLQPQTFSAVPSAESWTISRS